MSLRANSKNKAVPLKSKKVPVDDLLGKPKKVRAPKAKKVKAKKVKADIDDLLGVAKKEYKPLPEPKAPLAKGIFALREQKGQNLGRTCLNPDCKAVLKHKRGRPAVICPKHECYRFYRNAYRLEYDKVRGAA